MCLSVNENTKIVSPGAISAFLHIRTNTAQLFVPIGRPSQQLSVRPIPEHINKNTHTFYINIHFTANTVESHTSFSASSDPSILRPIPVDSSPSHRFAWESPGTASGRPPLCSAAASSDCCRSRVPRWPASARRPAERCCSAKWWLSFCCARKT